MQNTRKQDRDPDDFRARHQHTRSRPVATTRGPDLALYAISVASELTGVDPQMLRVYERRSLLTPARTEGGTRRYSDGDIERINRITMYLGAGLNLAGIERVLILEAEGKRLREQVLELGGEPDPAG
jgi:MerR family transcriptional regulator, heat shock protein HspR